MRALPFIPTNINKLKIINVKSNISKWKAMKYDKWHTWYKINPTRSQHMVIDTLLIC